MAMKFEKTQDKIQKINLIGEDVFLKCAKVFRERTLKSCTLDKIIIIINKLMSHKIKHHGKYYHII